MVFKAILTDNYRDTDTGAPKVLLKNIKQEGAQFRDHCWVPLTKELRLLLRKYSKATILFEGEVQEYLKRATTIQQTLTVQKIIRIW